ncbi:MULTISPECIES: type I-E CRISPR-associated protein Cse2/CasB [Streptomyces]|uniref:Type I-E CRISPR-associated protein Cse2/CasB n=1 Tax=Streptomyces ramulosus TaxID=47762 RepID=A0ABW1FSI9_9ACTN
MAEDHDAAARARRTEHLRFVSEIQRLCADSPEAHARLRRGLGKDVDQVAGMHEFIAHWLPERRHRERDRAYYTVAALIADQPRHVVRGRPADDAEPEPLTGPYGSSFGHTLAESVLNSPAQERPHRRDTTRRRLSLLVRQSPTGLHRYLPSATRLLRRYETEPDWAQLLNDLARWPWNAADIGSRWQQDYFRTLHRDEWSKNDKADATQAVPQPGSSAV